MSEYASIREILGHLIGNKVIDITQHDEEDFNSGRDSFVELMFEDGCTLKFFALDGDKYKSKFPFCTSNVNDDDDGFFHPDPEAAAKDEWVVVEQPTDDGPVGHVIPCAGKLHEIDDVCWCAPRKEFKDDGTWFFNHKKEE